MSRTVRQSLVFVVLFAAYAATARLGLSFDALGGIATTVWPPTGIALAALILAGPRLWPAVTLAAFAVNATLGIPIWSAAIIAIGNTLEAVIGSVALRRMGFDSRLCRLSDVLLLVLIGALLSTTVSATFGTIAATLGHVPVRTSLPAFWTVWWVGDCLGDLLVAPLLLVWFSAPQISRRAARWVEAALLAACVAFASLVFFRHMLGWRAVRLVLRGTYPIMPFLIWAAIRFEQRGVTATLILVAGIAISGAAHGDGMFANASMSDRLLLVQSYMGVTAACMMMLAAALAERRAAIAARDEFISVASHELKTPLTALKLRLDAAERIANTLAPQAGGETAKLTRAIVAANLGADRLDALIDDLLDASRLSAGRLALQLERIELLDLVRDMAGRWSGSDDPEATPIDVRVTAGIAGRWDRMRLEQVVTNLLSNAVKYGGDKPILVTAEQMGDRIKLRVKDGGRGIPRADQTRIFRAFERLPSDARVPGLGLGLYIARQIALAHGGTLTLHSEPNHGSVFTLDLPLEAPTGETPTGEALTGKAS